MSKENCFNVESHAVGHCADCVVRVVSLSVMLSVTSRVQRQDAKGAAPVRAVAVA